MCERQYRVTGFFRVILTVFSVLLASSNAFCESRVLLWDGENGQAQVTGNYQVGTPSSISPHGGQWCFEGAPDRWNSPTISLSTFTSFRKNLTAYTELRFYARADAAGKTFDVAMDSYNPNRALSNTVNINSYIQGGALDTSWRLVTIPFSALENGTYTRSVGIDHFFFGVAQPADSNHHIYIDDIYAVNPTGIDPETTPTPEETPVIPENFAYSILSHRAIKITLRERYDTASAATALNYVLSSTNDISYTTAASPASVGRRFSVIDFPPQQGWWHGSPTPVLSFDVFLLFSQPFKNNSTYRLQIRSLRKADGSSYPTPQNYDFTFTDTALINGSVKTNHFGYLPAAAKFAYIGNYLGDLGMLPISPSSCEIRDALTGSTVLTKPARFRADDAQMSGEKIYDCDFSELSEVGSYYVYVPGVGRSHSFRVSPDVLNPVLRALSRVYYYQRAGMPIEEPFAEGWPRRAGHVTTDKVARIHESNTGSPLWDPVHEPIGSTIDLSGGWYDAGDYGKYTLVSAITIAELLNAYEVSPEKFKDRALHIPESGNGVPDFLDEVKYQVDWFRNMQAYDDGVFDRVVTRNWASTMPEEDTARRDVAEKTTFTTAHYAAAMAQASRSFKPYWPAYSDDLLVRAKKAWVFLSQHTSPIPAAGYDQNQANMGGGDYVDWNGDSDSRAWAAAELYKTTGDPQYRDEFAKWTNADPLFGESEIRDQQKRASFAYATATFPIDPLFLQKYKAKLKEFVDWRIAEGEKNVWRAPYPGPHGIGYGNFSDSARYSWEIIKALHVLKDLSADERRKYLRAAELFLDPQLGCNPEDRTYISGLGHNSPRDPLSTITVLDGIAAPFPGLAVYGPFTELATYGGQNLYAVNVQSPDYRYPRGQVATDPYPILRRYSDVHELPAMSEFSIGDTALMLGAYAYLSSALSPTTPNPPQNLRVLQK